MPLGKYFTLAELTASDAAAKHGIPNDPSPAAVASLQVLVANVLDPLREKLGKPILINSGYRSPKVNDAVGGAKNSQHMLGQAADIHVKGMSVAELHAFIRNSGLPFDQLIDEFGSWVHVSYGPEHRRQVMTARTVAGRTVYTNV